MAFFQIFTTCRSFLVIKKNAIFEANYQLFLGKTKIGANCACVKYFWLSMSVYQPHPPGLKTNLRRRVILIHT